MVKRGQHRFCGRQMKSIFVWWTNAVFIVTFSHIGLVLCSCKPVTYQINLSVQFPIFRAESRLLLQIRSVIFFNHPTIKTRFNHPKKMEIAQVRLIHRLKYVYWSFSLATSRKEAATYSSLSSLELWSLRSRCFSRVKARGFEGIESWVVLRQPDRQQHRHV